jgi:DNA-binding transcriptional LysR family regulator
MTGGGARMTLQQLRYIITIERCGSFSEAAKQLFTTQPNISTLVKELEAELGIIIFLRSKKGITITQEGKEFLAYAYQMTEKEDGIKNHFQSCKEEPVVNFSVSSQHYLFVVDVFTKLEKSLDVKKYALRLKETQTATLIEDVARLRSEIGVLASSKFTEKHISKLLNDNNLMFHPLLSVSPKAFMSKKHPLSGAEQVTLEELNRYPCIVYDQNDDMAFHFSEESVVPDFRPNKTLYISDLLTSIYLMEGCDAFNIGTGLTTELIVPIFRRNMIATVPVHGQSLMTIGWIALKNGDLSSLARFFISMLEAYIASRSVT